jgi:hypothetical protein
MQGPVPNFVRCCVSLDADVSRCGDENAPGAFPNDGPEEVVEWLEGNDHSEATYDREDIEVLLILGPYVTPQGAGRAHGFQERDSG